MAPKTTVERLLNKDHLTIRPPAVKHSDLVRLVDGRIQKALRNIPHDVIDGGYRVNGLSLDSVLAALLKHLARVDVVLEFRNSDECTTQCQGGKPANYWKCVCRCRGRHHGGRDSGPAWLQKPGTELLIAEDVVRVSYEFDRADRHPDQ